MPKHLVLLAGWGLGIAPLEALAAALGKALPDFSLQLQPLPDLTAQDGAAVIAQLDQQLPKGCWLIGWSLGGMLATALAAQRQTACAGLITYASNPCFVARESWPHAMPQATFNAFRQLCHQDLGAGVKRFALLCSQGALQPRQLSRQLQDMAVLTDAGSALAGLDLLAELDNRAAIRHFAGRQLHVLAEADALLAPEAAALLQGLNPQAQVELLGQSHASVLAEPQLLAQRLSAFIQGGADA
ncbi:MAG: alpha/beta fold hydrolase [Pseudomonas sp.]|jgi:pimeloyl-[acyl-carrier protein] methyl ester esterase|nr:alpha/beta fold hydrolase [Pseudomonas sp.]NLO53612.1 alpha/beta fold hydrolase [Gammaproteobacteria bacterium]